MKKRYLYIIILITFVSCGLGDQIEARDELDKDLKNFLNTENLNTSIGFGTESEDNYVKIDFVEYDFESKDHAYLDSLSNVINNRIREKFPKIVKTRYIEIRYTTEKDIDLAKSVMSFKY